MRLINWESALNNYIERMSKQPFIWGVSDCCHFAAGAVKVVNGAELKAESNITDEKSAVKYVQKYGDVENIADEYLPRKDILYCMRGDIVSAYVDGSRIGLGVCMGDYGAFKTADGIIRKPLSELIDCWGVM